MNKLIGLLILVMLVSGCAYSIKNIDVSGIDPICTRECTTSYSTCASGGVKVGFNTETLRACKEAYSIGVSTCPAK